MSKTKDILHSAKSGAEKGWLLGTALGLAVASLKPETIQKSKIADKLLRPDLDSGKGFSHGVRMWSAITSISFLVGGIVGSIRGAFGGSEKTETPASPNGVPEVNKAGQSVTPMDTPQEAGAQSGQSDARYTQREQPRSASYAQQEAKRQQEPSVPSRG